MRLFFPSRVSGLPRPSRVVVAVKLMGSCPPPLSRLATCTAAGPQAAAFHCGNHGLQASLRRLPRLGSAPSTGRALLHSLPLGSVRRLCASVVDVVVPADVGAPTATDKPFQCGLSSPSDRRRFMIERRK